MMNKKIIAILMAAMTVAGLSAQFCHDEYGNRISCTGRVVEGTFNTAEDVAGGAVEATGEAVSVLNPFNWGEGGEERRQRRAERREERRARREERRAGY